jgi:putative phage-type endonuclease
MSNDRYYIGGGNAAGILGVSPYKSPLQEYLTIIGEDHTPEDRVTFFRRRKALEPYACEIFQEETGLAIGHRNRRFTDRQLPFIRAEIDAETADQHNIELKSVHPMAARAWGEEGADNCPVYVTAQAQHGLMVTGRQLCYVLAMIGFDDVRVYRIERDDEIIAAIRAREVAFWTQHVEPRVPPDPTNVTDLKALYGKDAGLTIEATPEIADRVVSLVDRCIELKTLQTEVDADKEAIQLFMRDAAVLTIHGKPALTWKTQRASRFDQTAFKAAHPALYEQFKSASESRVFRIR